MIFSAPGLRSPRLAVSLIAALAAALAPASFASADGFSPSRAASDDFALAADAEITHLDELVVSDFRLNSAALTAVKLPLTARELPQSVSSVDRQLLDAESLFSVNEVLQGVTGVHVSFYDSQRPLYFARGFQITDFQVDGIPTYSGSTNQEYDTALYERIDIVRGANGLLSGAGVPSATINLLRKRPGKEFAADLRATTGSWNYYRGEGDVTVPLTRDGRFRSRFVVTGQSRDSFRDRYAEEKFAWLAAVEGDLTATTTIGVGHQYQENDPTSPIWGVIPRFAADGSLAQLPRSISFSTHWTEWSRDSGTTFVTLDQKLGDNWTVRAAYNRTEGSTFSLRVYALGFPDLATGSGMRLLGGVGETDDVRDNLDLYASGKFVLFGREHDLVLGWNSNNLEADSPTFASIASWNYTIPDYRTWNGDAPAPVVAKTGARRVAITDQSGVYTSLRLRLLDPLAVIVGARLSSWETKTDNYDTSGIYTSTTGAYEVNDEVTPYVGVVYDFNPVWSAYASYTDIFRPQNYKDKDNNLLSPVLGTNLEAGVKAEFFAKRLQLSLGVFDTQQDNYAVRDATQPDNSLPDGSSAYIGVDGTQSRGVEVELHGYIQPGWTMTLGYSNVNTRRHALDLTYANVPEHLVRFSTHYQLPGRWNRLSLGTGVNWQGEAAGFGISHPTLGTVTVHQSAFALVNVFASYRFTDHLSASLSVRNAFDKTYWATLDYPNYGEPRTVQASLRWRF
jgi:outer membrane receptor for ferric coprogen and ferric-rhodotorulic acid